MGHKEEILDGNLVAQTKMRSNVMGGERPTLRPHNIELSIGLDVHALYPRMIAHYGS